MDPRGAGKCGAGGPGSPLTSAPSRSRFLLGPSDRTGLKPRPCRSMSATVRSGTSFSIDSRMFPYFLFKAADFCSDISSLPRGILIESNMTFERHAYCVGDSRINRIGKRVSEFDPRVFLFQISGLSDRLRGRFSRVLRNNCPGVITSDRHPAGYVCL